MFQNQQSAHPYLTPRFSWAAAVGPPPPLLGPCVSVHPETGLPLRPCHGGRSQESPSCLLSLWPSGVCREPLPIPHPHSSVPARSPFTIFQGGMPRASYGDRHCISVIHNDQQTAFDFTSRVIDFTVLAEADPAAGRRASGMVVGG